MTGVQTCALPISKKGCSSTDSFFSDSYDVHTHPNIFNMTDLDRHKLAGSPVDGLLGGSGREIPIPVPTLDDTLDRCAATLNSLSLNPCKNREEATSDPDSV